MGKFEQLKASQKLQELAKNPFDLTQSLTPERLSHFKAESAGYQLFYGTERVTEEVMQELRALAKEAKVFEKMHDMQAGKVLNFIKGFPSENRAVLHTATRDFFDRPQKSSEAIAAAKAAKKELEKIGEFVQKVDLEKKFNNLILIGIGGSYLGPKATYLALKKWKKPGRHVHFISNVDPDDAAQVLEEVDLAKTLVMVVSKTGTTLETLTNETLVREKFHSLGLNSKDHFVSVTGEGSPLDDKEHYLECFYIWDWIGGRFSTSSAIGGVLISFMCGFDIYLRFLKGAHEMDKAALEEDPSKNIALLAALLAIWNRNFLNYPTLAIIPYSQALSRFVAHIQQVEMESNGKHIDQKGNSVNFQTGPIVWGEPGTDAQHSFYQLIHQGTSVIPVEFIGFKKSQYGQDIESNGTSSQEKLLANLFAQMIALATGQQSDNPNKIFEGNRPNHLLLANQLTPEAVGALLAFYEHKVAFEGFIWNINSFDQEGVQLGKVLANKIIQRMSHPESTQYPLGDVFLKELYPVDAK